MVKREIDGGPETAFETLHTFELTIQQAFLSLHRYSNQILVLSSCPT